MEVARGDGLVVLRDSARPQGGMLHYGFGEWRDFVRTIKAGELDRLGS